MADGYVRKLGQIDDADGAAFSVGIDGDLVVIWPGEHENPHKWSTLRLTPSQAEGFGRLFVAAVWEAGLLKAQADQEFRYCPAGCGCRLGTDDADRRECGCDEGCCDA